MPSIAVLTDVPVRQPTQLSAFKSSLDRLFSFGANCRLEPRLAFAVTQQGKHHHRLALSTEHIALPFARPLDQHGCLERHLRQRLVNHCGLFRRISTAWVALTWAIAYLLHMISGYDAVLLLLPRVLFSHDLCSDSEYGLTDFTTPRARYQGCESFVFLFQPIPVMSHGGSESQLNNSLSRDHTMMGNLQ